MYKQVTTNNSMNWGGVKIDPPEAHIDVDWEGPKILWGEGGSISIENRHFCSKGVCLARNFKYKGLSPANHSSCRKTRIGLLSCGIKKSGRFWQTYGQKDFRNTVRCITCSRRVISNGNLAVHFFPERQRKNVEKSLTVLPFR